ncbi:MAG: NAD(+) kinase [Oceanococcus sp.]
MNQFKTIGLVVKTDAKSAPAAGAQVLTDLRQRELSVLLDRGSARVVKTEASELSISDLGQHCDLVIVMGGDGTLLHAGRALAASEVPLLGVNLGRLGFMVDIAPQDITASLNRILDGEHSIEERLILEAQDGEGRHPAQIAINDVVVRHQRYVRMLDFSTTADDTFISQHRADGVIVSTPTGSTAYALSSGGPMMHPGVDAMAVVPISPHTLSDRPLILSADSQLCIEIGNQADNAALFTCDGQLDINLEPGSQLLIRRSALKMRLVHPLDYDYYGILRNKLHWGRNRNQA